MDNNLPLGADFDSNAPWKREEPSLACPICFSRQVEAYDNVASCISCGFEDFVGEFVEAGENEREWEEMDYGI